MNSARNWLTRRDYQAVSTRIGRMSVDERRARQRAAMARWLSNPANREKARARSRDWYRRNREKSLAQSRLANEIKQQKRAEMLQAQNGLCYMCNRELRLEDAVVDHWHGCCPAGKDKYCARCIRGLAHNACNTLLGLANEDPAILRHIADAVEAANQKIPESLLLWT